MEQKIKKLILDGNFLSAKQLACLIDYQTLSDALMTIVFEYRNICAYTFIFVLLCEHETVEYHGLAMEILVHGFPHLEGSYRSAMYHVRRLIELDPDDVGLKVLLLFFNDVPCKPLKDQEAKQIALEILAVDKDNERALDTMRKLGNAKQE